MVDSTNLPDVDINQIATDLNGKMDIDGINATASVCVESWHDNNGNWYRVYSDGWCEQGGKALVGTSAYTVTLQKLYKDNKYNITATGCSNANVQIGIYATGSETTSTFQLMASYSSIYIYWRTAGYMR